VHSSNSADTVTVGTGATVGGQTIEHLGDTGLGHHFGSGHNHDDVNGHCGGDTGEGSGSGSGSSSGSTTSSSTSTPTLSASLVSGSAAAVSPVSSFFGGRFSGFRRFGR